MGHDRRQRNKKKFGTVRSLRRPKDMTVKVKPKEREPCRTRNPKPKIKTPSVGADRRRISDPPEFGVAPPAIG
jgi:hypothetical protein